MKKTILTFAVTGVIAVASLTAFGQENKKAAEARKDVAESQKDLKEAKTDSAEDFKKFKKDAELQIGENQKKIAELKAKKSNDNKEAREKYDKKVLALEQKNNELKKKIEVSDNTKTSMWSSFKREFNHDMSELGHAIKNIGVDNEK
jgi:phosphoenolpyruvate-protein kinase (PTS system EI component)